MRKGPIYIYILIYGQRWESSLCECGMGQCLFHAHASGAYEQQWSPHHMSIEVVSVYPDAYTTPTNNSGVIII